MFCNVPLNSLPIGARLGSSIYDDRQTKLLAAGMEITEHLLESLQRRTVDSVVVNQGDLGRIMAFTPQGRSRSAPGDRRDIRTTAENDVSRELDRRVGAGLSTHLGPSASPFAKKLQPTAMRPYDRELMNFLAERREYQVDRLHRLAEACARGNADDLEITVDVVNDSLNLAVEDFDAYACLGTTPHVHPYPTRHVLHTAMVAQSIGIALGLDEQSLTELGIGCLIHDLGMLSIDRMTIGAKKFLDPAEFAEIAKHPLHTFDLIEKQLDVVPVAARMVAYQMHERCNGSGYPRGRTKEQIHPLARIAAVADTFVALATARPHRPGMLPYYAIEKLVKDTARGLYDPQAVRGLLQSVSLFPLGSYVQISGQFIGRVIRSNAHDYSRPVVELWKSTRTAASARIVDLSQETEFAIERVLDGRSG